MEYRHCAYNIRTGEIINAPGGHTLKRAVALTKESDKAYYGTAGQWRFCHDFGKKWNNLGLPQY